ncbi:hypothetical protein NDU88_000178 [Pleurodeles waltl]|uniref:Uncharacterized protein n=1 Tax=Pleurodeles waltl TaxID=8319 RepID=A0AAV7U4M9_PLEWA|nr:hypothetical protein NDU88_000178 [Pleurodeles waltl]
MLQECRTRGSASSLGFLVLEVDSKCTLTELACGASLRVQAPAQHVLEPPECHRRMRVSALYCRASSAHAPGAVFHAHAQLRSSVIRARALARLSSARA